MRDTEEREYVIIGGGITGLALANWLPDDAYVIIERDPEIGGYCKTIRRNGYTWDYSGHFFHFQRKEIEQYLFSRMEPQHIYRGAKRCYIYYDGQLVDYPFQQNIHQLKKADFLACLYDLLFRENRVVHTFKDMLIAHYGHSIAEKFLIPYNEKVYSVDLDHLDPEAMGRFFPHVSVEEIVQNFRGHGEDTSYNAEFAYPAGGAFEYVKALAQDIPAENICVNEQVLAVDISKKTVVTNKRTLFYDRLVNTIPLPRFLDVCDWDYDPDAYTCSKVLVFNLGFDRKGWEGVHWVYFPQVDLSFYRVGFYDNLFASDEMSLYVEVGLPMATRADESVVRRTLDRILVELEGCGIVRGHKLVSWHSVVMAPAYVHITPSAQRETARQRRELGHFGVSSIGRYGAWTYCSIEDNIIQGMEHAVELQGEGWAGILGASPHCTPADSNARPATP